MEKQVTTKDFFNAYYKAEELIKLENKNNTKEKELLLIFIEENKTIKDKIATDFNTKNTKIDRDFVKFKIENAFEENGIICKNSDGSYKFSKAGEIKVVEEGYLVQERKEKLVEELNNEIITITCLGVFTTDENVLLKVM